MLARLQQPPMVPGNRLAGDGRAVGGHVQWCTTLVNQPAAGRPPRRELSAYYLQDICGYAFTVEFKQDSIHA